MKMVSSIGGRRQCFCSMMLLLSLNLLSAGCSGPTPVTIPVSQLPDGDVEVLEIDADGKESHTTGKLQQLADRSDDTFVMVDFWATWCGPCVKVNSELKTLKKEWKDKLTILKVNVDQPANRELVSSLRVSGIPMMLVCQSGKVILRFEGAYPAAEMSRALRSFQ